MDITQIKQRFGIVGNSPLLNMALETVLRVSGTDLSVLVTGESGVGKEIIPQVIHHLSPRKHNPYIAVNCGAIPEGTIDSELFGHEKGSFTGAHEGRKGYFEEAKGGTIFLDEVAELPLQTQVRLLRVLETGEYLRVGSSKVHKTDVRIVAATNVNIPQAIAKGKFREDLYYRLNTVPIKVPALKDRKEDIHLLFRKFAADFAEKYRMPAIHLSEDAVHTLSNYSWQGNIRQLKNISEQISVIETERKINSAILKKYLPEIGNFLPAIQNKAELSEANFSEREILYKILFDMKKDLTDVKKLVLEMINTGNTGFLKSDENIQIIKRMVSDVGEQKSLELPMVKSPELGSQTKEDPSNYTLDSENKNQKFHDAEDVTEESLSIEDKEVELIQKALERHRGKRKYAAKELGISERTLYRKIKEYNIKK